MKSDPIFGGKFQRLRLSGKNSLAPLPTTRIASGVVDGRHRNLGFIDAINDKVWKSLDQSDPQVAMHFRVEKRVCGNSLQDLLDPIQEFVAQSLATQFVLGSRLGKIVLRLGIEDNGPSH